MKFGCSETRLTSREPLDESPRCAQLTGKCGVGSTAPTHAVKEPELSLYVKLWCIDWETSMARRSRIIQSTSLEVRLTEEAKRLREEALQLPPGAAREELIRKARQAETGSHMSEWLASPGLQPPN